MWQVAEQCLRENQAPSGSGPIFDTLPVERAELSLLLVQRLAGSSPALGDVNQMLGTIWATINSIEQPYSPQGLAYHRLLLRILYVTLRAYNRSQKKAKPDAKVVVAVTQTMLNIVDKVVARGFRDVASLLHDPNTMMVPEDIQILTAILQASLLMPGMSETDVQLLNIMVSHDVLHIATSLYSWSDKLTTNGDPEVGRPGIPVFAEPALLFLVELSTIAPIAEQLACDGLLDNLASARMTQLMDRPGVGPFVGLDTNANPNPVGEICYSAWSRGLLPLLLNIFVAVGPPIAGEVAAVLSRFPTLLRGAVDRLEAPGGSRIPGGSGRRRRVGFAFGANGGPSDDGTVVTLRSVEEVHTLALLSRSLAAVRNGALGAGSGAGVRGGDAVPELPPGCFDEQALLENVEFWLSRRAVLRERIVPLPGTREVEWAVTKPTTTGKQMVGLGVAEPPESLLEEKVVSLLELVRAVLSNDGSSGPAGEIGGGLS